MKTRHLQLLVVLVAALLPLNGFAQVNSGSDGHDGALNPTANLAINMADHPDGIYHYTSVNIPSGVTITFIPNANNKPVVWLVQGNCVINGVVDVSGSTSANSIGGVGGPGGWDGGSGGSAPHTGFGVGSGSAGFWGGNSTGMVAGGNGSFGTKGGAGGQYWPQAAAGETYGNSFLVPLLGGSGGGGGLEWSGNTGLGGGGGGGGILIATSQTLTLNGSVLANGGGGRPSNVTGNTGGGGSGGSVRFVGQTISGTGIIRTVGGPVTDVYASAGTGRVRFDSLQNTFGGSISGSFTQGFQPIILPASGQGVQLAIASIAGNAVPGNPSGVQASPDVIIPAQQTNPIPIVVNCTNIPLNTSITVVIHPTSGADVQAVGINNAGTTAASTATISVNMPRGGGVIYAKAVTGIAGSASVGSPDAKTRSIADTGWTAEGERFAQMEITAALGSKQQITYITESGKRYSLAAR